MKRVGKSTLNVNCLMARNLQRGLCLPAMFDSRRLLDDLRCASQELQMGQEPKHITGIHMDT